MKRSFARNFPPLLAAAAALLLVACASDNKRPEYYDAVEVPSLEIPEGLSKPNSSSALLIQAAYSEPPAVPVREMPPRISNTTSGLNDNSRLNWSVEGLFLLVNDTPESTQRRLGFVLKNGGMKRIREDENGVYRFDYYQVFAEKDGFFRKMAFWSENEVEDYSGAYQVYTQPDGNSTRVYIKYADGTECEPDAAEHVLAVLSARMG